MEPTLVVIGQETIETSRGTLAVGELLRLPVVEAIQLHSAQKVALGSWEEQQLPEIPVTRRRYRRRDMQADQE